MRTTLYVKMAAVLFGLLALIGISYVGLTLYTTQMYFEEINQKLNRFLAQQMVSEHTLLREGRVNHEALQDLFHGMMVTNPSIEVYLLDSQGTLLSYSAPPGKIKRQAVSLEPIRRFLSRGAKFPIRGDDPRGADRRKVFSAAPISAGDQVQGYLYVILGGEEYDSVVQMLQGSYILRLSTWAVAGGVIVALAVGLVVFNLLTRRLRRLAVLMDRFQQSQFSRHINFSSHPGAPSGDEVERLGTAFDHMAGRIMQQVERLKETDALRRELVANISHDLRTPLASLQGYLETLLLKDERLDPLERKKFLEIAAKHSKRLGILIAELFELARLDSHETRLHPEPFSLAELVQDILQKLQLAAERRHVRLQSEFSENLPFVYADIGLVERVFVNLIENALRFTPAGGQVTIRLVGGGQVVTAQVSDTGKGIPQDQLPHIFDRFYRAQRDKPQMADGAGLGLAIAKRILELHGTTIEVRSTPDVGTTFTFELPACGPV